LRKENNERTKDLNKTWEVKYRALEETLKTFKTAKENLEYECQTLRKTVLDLKLEHEQHIMEVENSIKDSEEKNYMAIIKGLEQKVLSAEANQSSHQRSIQEL
jgi:hypothetical protein